MFLLTSLTNKNIKSSVCSVVDWEGKYEGVPSFISYFEIPRLIQELEGVNMYVNSYVTIPLEKKKSMNLSVRTFEKNKYFMPFTDTKQY